ncbi:MAG: phasin family protein [Tardiphaga sp.]|nr:phasin family protein [Tardiphaga sp.]MDB5548369.1 phasin family protein [Tardiphaga sp.]MDB5572966.1 phasin family protein [Tardiphaga sp.]MDB5626754.1 phasin family protein [Tardiphaga sp.]MDB5627677.1 phasin family protein [Tardiphaga sp.]
MVKVEEMQQMGKEQIESAQAAAGDVQKSLQAIATAYGDYSKKSFEEGKEFIEKLSGVKSMDKVLELQTEYAKTSYEAFVAETQKIGALYADMAKQSFKPFEGIIAKMTPAR